jgi:hypothetical protein
LIRPETSPRVEVKLERNGGQTLSTRMPGIRGV